MELPWKKEKKYSQGLKVFLYPMIGLELTLEV